MSEQYNFISIGGGAAGLVSAYIGAAGKAKVALVERHKMGGDCLNYGCVPSKAIIKTAKFVSDMRNSGKYGIKNVSFDFDFSEVMDRVHEIIKTIEPADSVERYESLGVECFQGNAELLDPNTVKVGDKILKTKNIILGLGAAPFVPPIKGLDQIKYRTSENLWELRELPKRFVVLGGGPIGSEMAQAFARLGSEVTQVEMAPRILGREDDDVADLIIKAFQDDGVTVLTGAKASEVLVRGDEKSLLCEMSDGSKKEVAFDEILVAVGRKARTDQFDWASLGCELNPNGTVKVDEYLRANGKNIYACGDVAGPYQFTHTAAHQAWFCAVNALAPSPIKFKVNYDVIPWVTFTDPEVAQVGHNEMSATKAGVPFEKTVYELGHLDRAVAESANKGLVKILTVPGKDKILGATIVASHAGEMLPEFVTAMKYGLGLKKILGTIHAYPTWSEANKYAAGNWQKENKPEGLLGLAEQFHSWGR